MRRSMMFSVLLRKDEYKVSNWRSFLESNAQIIGVCSCELEKAAIYADSINTAGDSVFFMAKDAPGKVLVIVGEGSASDDFKGTVEKVRDKTVKICALTHANAVALRKHFPYTAPKCLRDSKITIGLGDRLGLATPGHLKLVKNYPVSPVLCQQSIRELNLTGRTYPAVLDDVSWGVFQEGYKEGFGADGDHLKTVDDIKMALDTGFTMITLDCSEHIDNSIASKSDAEVDAIYQAVDAAVRKAFEEKYLVPISFDGISINISANELKRIVLIYSKAVNFAEKIFKDLLSKNDNVVFELSIDETLTPTAPEAHYFVAAELRDRGVRVDNLAPRFIGEFQKGIDYVGNIDQFTKEFAEHCRIADHFGYKISVHSGSDKFSVFPIVGEETHGRYHLKTAGTNWLEAVRVIAQKNPQLYRRMHKFALENIDEAKKYYHISAEAGRIPDIDKMSDAELPSLMDQNDARQYLHITYGLILNAGAGEEFKKELYETLNKYEEDYYAALIHHIGRHLDTLRVEKK